MDSILYCLCSSKGRSYRYRLFAIWLFNNWSRHKLFLWWEQDWPRWIWCGL